MAAYAGDPNNYPATADLPEGGYQRNAGSVRIGDEAALDRTAWLNAARPLSVVAEIPSTTEVAAVLHESLGATNPDTITDLLVQIPDAVAGEVIDIEGQITWDTNGLNVQGRAMIVVTEDVGGTPTDYDHEAGKIWILSTGAVTDYKPGHSIMARHTVTASGDLDINIEVFGTAGNGGAGAFDTSTDRIRILKGCIVRVTRYGKGM